MAVQLDGCGHTDTLSCARTDLMCHTGRVAHRQLRHVARVWRVVAGARQVQQERGQRRMLRQRLQGRVHVTAAAVTCAWECVRIAGCVCSSKGCPHAYCGVRLFLQGMPICRI